MSCVSSTGATTPTARTSSSSISAAGRCATCSTRGRACPTRRWPSSGPRWPRAWHTHTPAGWCTATSSRPTSSSTRRAACGWPTSAWRGPWLRRPGPSRPGPWSARRATYPLRPPRVVPSTARQTCTRSRWCSTRRSPARCPSSPTPPWARWPPASASRCRTTTSWGPSTTCSPAPPRPTWPRGSTRQAWPPGWARWPRRCPHRPRWRSFPRTSRTGCRPSACDPRATRPTRERPLPWCPEPPPDPPPPSPRR